MLLIWGIKRSLKLVTESQGATAAKRVQQDGETKFLSLVLSLSPASGTQCASPCCLSLSGKDKLSVIHALVRMTFLEIWPLWAGVSMNPVTRMKPHLWADSTAICRLRGHSLAQADRLALFAKSTSLLPTPPLFILLVQRKMWDPIRDPVGASETIHPWFHVLCDVE